MDDSREFLETAAAYEETGVLGLLKSSIHHLREEALGSGDAGKDPSAAALLQPKQPDDWLIDQFGARRSIVVLSGATGAIKSTLVYGIAQAISTGAVFYRQLQCKRGKFLVIQSDESERNAQRKLQVMGMDPAFELLTDMKQPALYRLTRLQQVNSYDIIFIDSITTLFSFQRRPTDGGRGFWPADL